MNYVRRYRGHDFTGRSGGFSCNTTGALVVLFLLFDTALHLTKPTPVVEAFTRLGYPLSASVGIGIVEFLCLVVYVIPRTAALGAILRCRE
jgi:hypothetical protein